MPPTLGPVLYAADSTPDQWRFRVRAWFDERAAAADEPPRLMVEGGATTRMLEARRHQRLPRGQRWVVTWAVSAERATSEGRLAYSIRYAGETMGPFDNVSVPARGLPPRIACFSCAGFARGKDDGYGKRRHDLWRRMWEGHLKGLDDPDRDHPSGYQLLVGMGDQVYADELAVQYGITPRSRRSLGRRDQARSNFFNLYRAEWSQEPVARVLARVPGLFTWDDHEIRDGWGSSGESRRGGPLLDIYESAREVFGLVQLGLVPGEGDPGASLSTGLGPDDPEWAHHNVYRSGPGRPSHFLQHVSFRNAAAWVDVVALDLRSDRTPSRMLSEEQWAAFDGILGAYPAVGDGGGEIGRHLLVISSVPVIFYRFGMGILRDLILEVSKGKDDYLDQWEHANHQGERMRLLKTLLEFRRRTRCQVTVVSGDVHVAARGELVSQRPQDLVGEEQHAIVQQVVSSPLVNNPATIFDTLHQLQAVVGDALHVIDSQADEGDSVRTRLLRIEGNRTHVTERNFMAIRVDGGGRLWTRWILDDPERALSLQEVVEPLPRDS